MDIKNILIRQFTLNDYVTLYNHNKELLDSPLVLEDFVPYTDDPNLIGKDCDEDFGLVWTNNLNEIDIEEIPNFDTYKVYQILLENGIEYKLYTGWAGDAFTYSLTNDKFEEIKEYEEKLVKQLKENKWNITFNNY